MACNGVLIPSNKITPPPPHQKKGNHPVIKYLNLPSPQTFKLPPVLKLFTQTNAQTSYPT